MPITSAANAATPQEVQANCRKLVAEYYPHWSPDDPEQCKALARFDAFVESNKGKGNVAIFDWDGTLYSENVKIREYNDVVQRAAQPAWHIWGAKHMFTRPELNLFPSFRTTETADVQIAHVLQKDDYLESKLEPKPEGYDKFSQIAVFEAGMTQQQMTDGIKEYLKDIDPCKYVIYSSMDVAQRLVDAGFSVWVVTGSNPYFVSTLVNAVEEKCTYKKDEKYELHLGSLPYSSASAHVIGNSAKLGTDNRFSNVYDDSLFTSVGHSELRIVEKEGKKILVKGYVEEKVGKPAVFCAGNSGGDLQMMEYILSNEDAFGLFVDPRSGLEKMLTPDNKSRTIELHYSEPN